MICELSISVYIDNRIELFLTLKQLGPKRYVLDFDETGIGFPYLDIRKLHRSKLKLGRESEVKIKAQSARVIVVNSEGDSKMSVTK